MNFKVIEVTDGDTFKVSPNWKWNDKTGDTIRANGYNTPERGKPGHEESTEKLKKLILGKEVDLKTCIDITYGRLLCDVYYNGENLAEYFPEY